MSSKTLWLNVDIGAVTVRMIEMKSNVGRIVGYSILEVAIVAFCLIMNGVYVSDNH
jgi:hypothetical protein